jgi:phage host-nuclease inhibitor protein Gam
MRDHNAKTKDKSLALVHGQLKLRQQRDKLEIESLEQLMPVASAKGLLRVVPEAFEIDMPKLNKYVKASGDVPGVRIIPGDTKFSYSTIKGGNNVEQRQSSEAGIEPGPESTGDALEAAAHR